MRNLKHLSLSIYFLLGLSFLFTISKAQVPLTGGSAVKANFGIDADLYSNKLQFGYFHYNSTPYTSFGFDSAGTNHQIGTDDWFSKSTSWPGSGIGVIDTNGAAAFRSDIIAATTIVGRNKTFTRRMAYPIFSVAHGANATVTTPDTLVPQILIDAFGYRDNNALAAALDSSAFTSVTDNNVTNPKTWSVGAGRFSYKVDLIDVAAHLRMNELDSTLWGFFFATINFINGSNGIDLEIYRSNLSFNGISFSGFGPDSGHTAYYLSDANGALNRQGDLLLPVNVYNGTLPSVSIRIWVDPNNLSGPGSGFTIAAFNSLPAGPRPFSFTGVFDGSSGSAPFGWAEIIPKDILVEPAVFVRMNTIPKTSDGTYNTLGTPWGNLNVTNTPVTKDSMPKLQLVEVGINFHALNLDNSIRNNSTEKILGNLLIKTRSSASFNSELKDFAGPFPLGNFTFTQTGCTTNPPIANAGSAQTICTAGGTIVLAGSIGGSASSSTWSAPGGTFSDSNSLSPVYTPAISSGTVVLTLTTNDPDGTGPCVSAVSSVVITATPPFTNSINAEICHGDSYVLPNGQIVNTTGIYSTSMQTPAGCDSVIITNLIVHALPSVSVSANGPTTFCAVGNVTLTSNINNSYLWSNGATTQSINVSISGNYSVAVTDSNLCSTSSLPITVTVYSCPTSLNLRVFFEGFYRGNDSMSAAVIPILYPTLTDVTTVELHDSEPPNNIVYAVANYIDIYGYGNFYFPFPVSGKSFYIVVNHRNSIETWSKEPVLFDSTNVSFDFTRR